MASPFNVLRYSPTRWTQIEKEFPKGAHWLHSVERMFAVVLFNVNDGCRDLNVRYIPSLTLNGRQRAVARSLSVTARNVVRKRLTVKFDEKGCLIGESYICLDSEGAVTRLARALLDIVEKAWNSYGRDSLTITVDS